MVDILPSSGQISGSVASESKKLAILLPSFLEILDFKNCSYTAVLFQRPEVRSCSRGEKAKGSPLREGPSVPVLVKGRVINLASQDLSGDSQGCLT